MSIAQASNARAWEGEHCAGEQTCVQTLLTNMPIKRMREAICGQRGAIIPRGEVNMRHCHHDLMPGQPEHGGRGFRRRRGSGPRTAPH